MQLVELGFHNYKSLRSVTFRPGSLSLLVGANAAGKSNFCDALDFVGEMYRWGLELAVQRHGGYENICYRLNRRSKAPMRIYIRARIKERQFMQRYILGNRRRRLTGEIEFTHIIEFGTKTQSVQAPFSISFESVNISRIASDNANPEQLATYVRNGGTLSDFNISGLRESLKRLDREDALLPEEIVEKSIERLIPSLPETELALRFIERFIYTSIPMSRLMGAIKIFEFSPTNCRQDAVPIPNPQLERYGANLPAVIQYIRAHRPEQYLSLIETLQRVMPSLDDLEVAVTPQKTLSLLFKERGFSKPWSSMDVSDGTIRAIALLAAVFDPIGDVLIVEEPENSLHPWAIRQFVDACRVAAADKQIILTTHSPVLINCMQPHEVWITQRHQAKTTIEPVAILDPTVVANWELGEYTLASYLDSGAIIEAVPPPP